ATFVPPSNNGVTAAVGAGDGAPVIAAAPAPPDQARLSVSNGATKTPERLSVSSPAPDAARSGSVSGGSGVTLTLFDVANANVFALMSEDSFRRYLNSPRYQQFLSDVRVAP